MNLTRRQFLTLAPAAAAALALTRRLPAEAQEIPPLPARPNIVVILTDDQDAPSLAVMRKLLAAPGGGWTNFTTAVCNDGLCAPSRATLLTGQYSHHHGVERNGWIGRLDESNTLPVWLSAAGYRCAHFGKYSFGKRGRSRPKPPGWDVFDGKGGLADPTFSKAIDYIEHTGSEPFYLVIAPVDPHIKAKPPLRYRTAAVDLPPLPPNINEVDVSDKPEYIRQLKPIAQPKLQGQAAERVRAARALLAVDDGVQAVVEALASTGRLDNTAIFYLSDHGYSWGSHRMLWKHNPYEEVIRIPFLIRLPGQSENRVEPRLVSNVDVAPTICELAGIIPGRQVDGRSLLPLIQQTIGEWAEAALIEKHTDPHYAGEYFGLRTADYTYVEHDSGEKELYDLATDPYQLENATGQPDYADTQAQLAARLAAMKL